MCAVLARAWLTAVRAHGSGVSVHVSRRGRHYASVSGQERNEGESLWFPKKKKACTEHVVPLSGISQMIT